MYHYFVTLKEKNTTNYTFRLTLNVSKIFISFRVKIGEKCILESVKYGCITYLVFRHTMALLESNCTAACGV